MNVKTLLMIVLVVPLVFAETVYDSVGTNSNAAHCCDTNSITVVAYTPDKSTSYTFSGFSYVTETGTCGSTPDVEETWSRANSCTFCPVEGTYWAIVEPNIDRRVTGTDSGCPNTATEVSDYLTFYTVNYDTSSDWCGCKVGAGKYYAATDGSNGNCCGDDGTSDVFESAGAGNPACYKGEIVSHNSVSSDGRYLAYNGELHYCVTGAWGDVDSSGCSTIQRSGSGSIISRIGRFKVFFSHSPYSFVDNWNSCDHIGNWYCHR